MPHMSPIMWSLILILSLILVLTLTSMVYFNFHVLSPSSTKKDKEILKVNWKW
uniref:ATP synthase F0 subunit 8 n=1 Tax=Lepas anatifera TaxID=37710 RepID=UPI001FCDC819|nr:ATP synthase F0 subunit 8 [Lepas anatifera]UNZ93955.1 ATP synthase F0 subunit 8 [Lepas anatifera]